MKKRLLERFATLPFTLGIVLLVSFLIYFLLLPCPTISFREMGQRGKSNFLGELTMPLSFSFSMRYVHSVQKTLVEDEYYSFFSRIWQWEERVKSHNAGLPFLKKSRGRFFQDELWMYFQGGGGAFTSIRLRVGHDLLGRNQLLLPGRALVNLFSLYPGKVVMVCPGEKPLLWLWKNSFFS